MMTMMLMTTTKHHRIRWRASVVDGRDTPDALRSLAPARALQAVVGYHRTNPPCSKQACHRAWQGGESRVTTFGELCVGAKRSPPLVARQMAVGKGNQAGQPEGRSSEVVCSSAGLDAGGCRDSVQRLHWRFRPMPRVSGQAVQERWSLTFGGVAEYSTWREEDGSGCGRRKSAQTAAED